MIFLRAQVDAGYTEAVKVHEVGVGLCFSPSAAASEALVGRMGFEYDFRLASVTHLLIVCPRNKASLVQSVHVSQAVM